MENIKYGLSQNIHHPVKMFQQRSFSLKWLCFLVTTLLGKKKPLILKHKDIFQVCCEEAASILSGTQADSIITGPGHGFSCSV